MRDGPEARVDLDLVHAIVNRHRLRFAYHGTTRIAEPQCYGIGKKGTALLRVHQVQGGTEIEPLFDVARMSHVAVLDETFDRPGPHYRKNDSAMTIIFAQL